MGRLIRRRGVGGNGGDSTMLLQAWEISGCGSLVKKENCAVWWLWVHILCLSSQEHTQIRKKTLVSLANYSHSYSMKFLYSANSSTLVFNIDINEVVHVTVHADGTREHFFHVCCFTRILLLTYSIFVVDSLVIKTRCLCSNRWSNCITARRYLLKSKNIHSQESALSCKVFIQFYFRINGSTPHLCSLLPTLNQIWSRSQSQSLQKLWDRSLIAGEVFPILISEKARLWNSRSEGRAGGGGGCLPATCWSEEFMFVSSWWSGLKSFDLRF